MYLYDIFNFKDDIFPFKSELMKAIIEFEELYLTSEKPSSARIFLLNDCLISFQMMFTTYSKRMEVIEYVTEFKIYRYLSDISHFGNEIEDIINNLPPYLTNLSAHNQDECDLFKLLDKANFYCEFNLFMRVHEYVIKYINEKYPQYKV